MRLQDSILVSIPRNLTVDLGFCLERTKKKRLKKLLSWEKKYLSSNSDDVEETATTAGSEAQQESAVKDDKEGLQKGTKSNSKDGVNDFSDEEDIAGGDSNILRREQFGGIIDYLEAKYVRGVMVEDPDEKVQRKKEQVRKRKLKQMQQQKEGKRSKTVDDEASETAMDGDRAVAEKMGERDEEEGLTGDEIAGYSTEDDDRSIYSEDSFLDDSLLVKGVAEQVQASSAYGGVTKIESEAKRRKVEAEVAVIKNSDEKSTADEAGKISAEGIMFDHEDDGFFVNVGDLEMEEGYEEDLAIDWHLPEKNKSKITRKRKSAMNKIACKTLDTSLNESVTSKDKKYICKGTSSLKQPKNQKKEASDKQKELDYLEEQAKELFKEQRRLFDLSLKEILEMSEEQMPRKGLMETIKVTLSVPEGKFPGDSLMFNNPRDPIQRLKVTIPGNAAPGGSFMVSLPVPKAVVTDLEENNFSKGAREALHDYSKAFDAWVDVDWKIKELLGETGDLTLHKEKMKKFDELVNKFPEDLEIPVDIPFLRKVVRRVTQNAKKRRENAGGSSSPVVKLAAGKTEEGDDENLPKDAPNTPHTKNQLHLPAKATKFDVVKFNSLDFSK